MDIIKKVAEIPEAVSRNEKRDAYFAEIARMPAFRKMLARTIIRDQIKFDAGKANSNRYEQGTTHDAVIGFSGTAGDTSSYFKENMLDPAADGNMTLGIMARSENQGTYIINSANLSEADENYTTAMIAQLAGTFDENTRALIDVGGLCKVSNYEVAKGIALQLQKNNNPKLSTLEGVIFYDDVTNMKKVLVLDAHGKETIKDLTPDLVMKSDLEGKFFTYYDQSHSRGADIKQMNGAKAILTASLTLDNNDYKQAIMRMRKIVDKTLGQSFSIAVPEQVRKKIISDLQLDGCTLYLMSELPPDDVLEKYKGSYIVYRNSENGDKSLLYIKSDGRAERVRINNSLQFDKDLARITKQTSGSVHLSDSQVKTLITSNGGHTPLEKEHTLTGNDIAFWLRQKELRSNLNNISLFMMELDSIIKNAI
ncbi:hypothetical protein EP47_10620, partial [Legionella norrlandica]